MRVYIASPDAAGYGYTTCATGLEGRAATLLVQPAALTLDALYASIQRLHELLATETSESRLHGGQAPSILSGAVGSTAISLTQGYVDRREGPLFGAHERQPQGAVAFVVGDLADGEAAQALLDLELFVCLPENNFLEPLPRRRTVFSQFIGLDGSVSPMERREEFVHADGRVTPAPPLASSAPVPIVAPSGVTVPHHEAPPR